MGSQSRSSLPWYRANRIAICRRVLTAILSVVMFRLGASTVSHAHEDIPAVPDASKIKSGSIDDVNAIFAPMKNAIELLKKSSQRYSKILADWRTKGSPAISPQALDTVNADLLRVPRLFLNEKGLPERPSFKNQIYAPGAYTGYGAKPIAAVREYMDAKKWKEADTQIPQVAQVIENVAAGIDRAATDLENSFSRQQ
jgi:Transferrin receptor-like dimerisation domain